MYSHVFNFWLSVSARVLVPGRGTRVDGRDALGQLGRDRYECSSPASCRPSTPTWNRGMQWVKLKRVMSEPARLLASLVTRSQSPSLHKSHRLIRPLCSTDPGAPWQSVQSVLQSSTVDLRRDYGQRSQSQSATSVHVVGVRRLAVVHVLVLCSAEPRVIQLDALTGVGSLTSLASWTSLENWRGLPRQAFPNLAPTARTLCRALVWCGLPAAEVDSLLSSPRYMRTTKWDL